MTLVDLHKYDAVGDMLKMVLKWYHIYLISICFEIYLPLYASTQSNSLLLWPLSINKYHTIFISAGRGGYRVHTYPITGTGIREQSIPIET